MLKLKKNSFYYSAIDDDALVLMAVTGCKLKCDGSCSFNAEYIDKIVKALVKYEIPYSIEKDGTLAISKSGSEKNYSWFLVHGKTIKRLQDEMNEDVKRIRAAIKNANQI